MTAPQKRARVLAVYMGLWATATMAAAAQNTHTVARGDTLSSIARQRATTVEALCAANKIARTSTLRVGQKLVVPSADPTPAKPGLPDGPPAPDQSASDKAPKTHAVRRGDTLSSIARAHRTTVEALRRWNGLSSKATLRVGQRLALGPPAPIPPAPRPTAPFPDADPPAPPPGKPTPTPAPAPAPDAPDAPRGVYVRGKVKTALDAPAIRRGRWKNIVIHHSGTAAGSLRVFDRYHRMRGMANGVAYHFVIGNGTYTSDGEIEPTARWLKQLDGGHLKSDAQNKTSLGICFVGNFNSRKPSARQLAACVELVHYLETRLGRPKPKLWLHREINTVPTECPGDLFPGNILKDAVRP